MSAWDDVSKAIEAGDMARTVSLVAGLTDAERREVARELPSTVKKLRAEAEFGFVPVDQRASLLLAGAGTIGGAAAAASWLCRRDLRLFFRGMFTEFGRELCRVTAHRPDRWRADVAHRVAARIRPGDRTVSWHAAAALTMSAGCPPPVTDGFVIGWAAENHPWNPDEYPFLDALLPKLFEVDGVGTALAAEPVELIPERPKTRRGEAWASLFADLAREGRLDRTVLLDGCVSRFLRGGTPNDLRWFCHLHTALDPTDEEAAARVRDYVRLLPSAPGPVADLALQQVRRVDDLGRLDDALVEEAAAAVLFRPEKKLTRTTLTWLDRTVRNRDRVDATLRAVLTAFGSDDLDVRERAVAIAAEHLPQASEPVRTQVRQAAADLPPSLRTAHAEAFGEVATPTGPEPAAGPPPFVPRPLPAPIGSLTELAETLAALLRTSNFSMDWRVAERCLAALVEFAHRDADATRKALRGPVVHAVPWLFAPEKLPADGFHPREWLEHIVSRLLFPDHRPQPSPAPGPFPRSSDPDPLSDFPFPVERFLHWRLNGIGHELGRVPFLLATPTEGSGHIDPEVLVDRLERLERAGVEPGRAELAQAMLRLPREIDPQVTARARSLTSPAGRSVASWLASGGLQDPEVACEVLEEEDPRLRRSIFSEGRIRSTVHLPKDAPAPADGPESDIARLCTFPEDDRENPRFPYGFLKKFWPSVLPSHRETTAAQAVFVASRDDANWNQGSILRDLAEADGPTGAATGTLLATALSNRQQVVRADVTEAFLVFTARGALPARETGEALGRLVSLGRLVLGRAVKSLTA
ncbi:MAG TPA: DUF6493 family protein, partial [Spirillospora sp.]